MYPTFTLGTNEAFTRLGALAPGQHWSQFDITLGEVRTRVSRPRVLATTIWHRELIIASGSEGKAWKPCIFEDQHDGSLWYRVELGTMSASPNHKAHWERIALARLHRIPIVGVLKCIESHKCCIDAEIKCTDIRDETVGNDNAVWLRLEFSQHLELDLGLVDIVKLTEFPPQLSTLKPDFQSEVFNSLRDSAEARRQRLSQAPRLPSLRPAASYEYIRNPDVVAEVLYQARGRCNKCKKVAPFVRRSDATPYLEVHHKRPLAVGGEDTVENAEALCPNCHREAHFG